MNRRRAIPLVLAIGGLLLAAGPTKAEEKEVDWKTLGTAKVSLQNGLAAAEQKGKPISAKFEMEDGKLQLSVYTARDGEFWEVVVDHATGKLSKTEEIKEGEDLSAAKTQSEAMAHAKGSLRAATEKAVGANSGYRAVSAVPEVKGGKPVATIVLENATGKKSVSESLE